MSVNLLNEIMESSDKVYMIGELVIDMRFWDCECEKQYIHSKNTPSCLRCGAKHEDQPDARANEIMNASNHEGLFSRTIARSCGYEVS
jgi:hypothetical protein